jgi:hypothetical protein
MWIANGDRTTPGGNPVKDVPGLSPTLPLMEVGPVLVTVEEAKTAKVLVDPRLTGSCDA